MRIPPKKEVILILSIVFILLIIIFLPIKFSYKITTAGKLLPERSWVVAKGNSGQLISFLNDRKRGIVDNYSVKEYLRGDDVNLVLNPGFGIGTRVKERDTIGFLYSNEIIRTLEELKSDLEIAKSTLAFNVTGEKQAIIEEAKENLAYQKQMLENQESLLERQRALASGGLITELELQISENQAALYKIGVDIANARLRTVTTGAKPEQIKMINNQIQSLKNQIRIYERRLNDYNLISPVSGVVTNISSGDTLFIISDDSKYVAILPVKTTDLKYIKSNCEVEIKLPFSPESASSYISSIDNSAYLIAGAQVIFALAPFEIDQQITNGLMVECKIDAGSFTIYEHLKRIFNQSL